MRETSLQAYADLVRDGRISKQQLLAWTVLQMNGPLTGRELEREAEHRGLWKRLSELQKLGLVVVDSPRTCSVSGKWAVTWRIGGPLELPPKRKGKPRRRFWVAVCQGHRPFAFSSELEALNSRDLIEVIEVREVIRAPVVSTLDGGVEQ